MELHSHVSLSDKIKEYVGGKVPNISESFVPIDDPDSPVYHMTISPTGQSKEVMDLIGDKTYTISS